jgi:hypothetical protein
MKCKFDSKVAEHAGEEEGEGVVDQRRFDGGGGEKTGSFGM